MITPDLSTMPDEAADFTDALLQYMRLRQVTKDELARRINRSPAAITNWSKKGGGRLPPLEDVIAMEDALELKRGTLASHLGHDLSDGDGKKDSDWERSYVEGVRRAPIDDSDRKLLIEMMRHFIEVRQESDTTS